MKIISDLWKRYFGKKPDNYSHLQAFVQNIYWSKDIPTEQSKRDLEDGIVEFVYENGAHAANGLLISDDGYVITCQHCIPEEEVFAVLSTGEKKRIKNICLQSEEQDLALIKLEIKGRARAKRYRLYLQERKSLAMNMPVVLLTRKNGRVIKKGGYVKESKSIPEIQKLKSGETYTYDILCDLDGVHGDSGGAIVTAQGELCGLVNRGRIGHSISLSFGIYSVLTLLSNYIVKNQAS